jgi:hypothetical protein
MTWTVWMSFTDSRRPRGRQFLGVVVMDVTEEEAAAAIPSMRALHPKAMEGAEVLWVAQQRAHKYGVNPGGSVASWTFPREEFDRRVPGVPRGELLSKLELEAFGELERRQ